MKTFTPRTNLGFPVKAWHQSQSVARPRILVVDDDPTLRSLHAMVLQLDDYEIETVADGAQALERLEEASFEVVVTDRAMPRLDGVSMIRELRARGNAVPVVMISGSLRDSPLPSDVAASVAVALPKPASADQIRAAVTFALNQGRNIHGHAEPVAAADSHFAFAI